MATYTVPSGNISGMTFGGGGQDNNPNSGSSLAPTTSKRPPRRPTYAETQAN